MTSFDSCPAHDCAHYAHYTHTHRHTHAAGGGWGVLLEKFMIYVALNRAKLCPDNRALSWEAAKRLQTKCSQDTQIPASVCRGVCMSVCVSV